MKQGLIICLLLAAFAAHGKSLKGRQILPKHYAPPVGNVACEMPGGHEYGRITETFDKSGGTVYFEHVDVDHYLLSVDWLKDPRPQTLKTEDFLQGHFSAVAMPRLLKHYPGGDLKESAAVEHQDQKLFYGIFYYPQQRNPNSVVGRKTRAFYRVLILHEDPQFVYTITHTFPSFAFSDGVEESVALHPEMLARALHRFDDCHFFENVAKVRRVSTAKKVKHDINIQLEDVSDASGKVSTRIWWDGFSHSPEAFIEQAQVWQVKKIYLPHGKASWARCVLAMSSQLGAEVFWGVEGTVDEYQQIEGQFSVTDHCDRP